MLRYFRPERSVLIAAGPVIRLSSLDTCSSSSRKRSTIRLCRAWSVQRLAHDPAGQLGGQRPDLGPQRGQRLLPLGLDLGLGGLGHPARLGLGLLAHLGDDLRALLPGLLAQPGRLVPGVGELLPVLLEQLLGLGLRLVGPVQAALDRSVRSASVFWIRGSTSLARMPNTKTNRIVPMMNSGHEGSSGSVDAVLSARGIMHALTSCRSSGT